MSEGQGQSWWSVTSAVMALLANCHRDSKGRVLRPDDFNPYAEKQVCTKEVIEVTPENLADFRRAFIGR